MPYFYALKNRFSLSDEYKSMRCGRCEKDGWKSKRYQHTLSNLTAPVPTYKGTFTMRSTEEIRTDIAEVKDKLHKP